MINSEKNKLTETAPVGYRYFTLIAAIFVAVLLITNIAAQKLVPVGPFIFTAGIFLFPFSYIFGDVLTEIYGYEKTKKVIWMGFGASAFMAIYLYMVVNLPPAPGWELQEAFASTLNQVPRIVAASLIAYLVGEFLNSFVISKMKVKLSGRYLWLRAILSTVVGQFADTAVFALIAFYGVIPNNVLFTAIWSGYLFKVFYEVIASPLTILVVNVIKRKEGIDVYDYNADYNPFKVGENRN